VNLVRQPVVILRASRLAERGEVLWLQSFCQTCTNTETRIGSLPSGIAAANDLGNRFPGMQSSSTCALHRFVGRRGQRLSRKRWHDPGEAPFRTEHTGPVPVSI